MFPTEVFIASVGFLRLTLWTKAFFSAKIVAEKSKERYLCQKSQLMKLFHAFRSLSE